VKAFACIGSEPTIMLTAPAAVTRKLLKRVGMSAKDIDLFEINEAFAAVVLRYLREMDLDPARVNVNGGAIAMGHPLGASGAIILGTALDELERPRSDHRAHHPVRRQRFGHGHHHRARVTRS
jgi:acetyl-CoA C-acetyltransferase